MYARDTDAPSCGVDDMTKLSYLHEPGVLQNLRSRYDMNEIYVRTLRTILMHFSNQLYFFFYLDNNKILVLMYFASC